MPGEKAHNFAAQFTIVAAVRSEVSISGPQDRLNEHVEHERAVLPPVLEPQLRVVGDASHEFQKELKLPPVGRREKKSEELEDLDCSGRPGPGR